MVWWRSNTCTQATPSRIVVVASLAHKMGGFDIADLNWEKRRYSPWPAYGQSKTANILHAREVPLGNDKAGLQAEQQALHGKMHDQDYYRQPPDQLRTDQQRVEAIEPRQAGA